MNPAEIAILIILGTVAIILLICFIFYGCLDDKYKHFYTETVEGYDLIRLLTKMDKILSKEQFLINRGADLRKMIDERRKYYIMNPAVAFELDSLRSDYMEVVKEYEEILQRKVNCQKAIDRIINNLPKKYKGALNYNWRQFK